MRGFTLLEVMIALAIMASVILTLLASVNYQLKITTNERSTAALTVLARAKLAELEQLPLQQKSAGKLEPWHSEISWQSELLPTELPLLKKLVLRVKRTSDKQEVTLERYVTQ